MITTGGIQVSCNTFEQGGFARLSGRVQDEEIAPLDQ